MDGYICKGGNSAFFIFRVHVEKKKKLYPFTFRSETIKDKFQADADKEI